MFLSGRMAHVIACSLASMAEKSAYKANSCNNKQVVLGVGAAVPYQGNCDANLGGLVWEICHLTDGNVF